MSNKNRASPRLDLGRCRIYLSGRARIITTRAFRSLLAMLGYGAMKTTLFVCRERGRLNCDNTFPPSERAPAEPSFEPQGQAVGRKKYGKWPGIKERS